MRRRQCTTPREDTPGGLQVKVFTCCPSTVHEEGLMAVGAIANVMGKDFAKYMQHFAHFLLVGLKSYQEYQVCAFAINHQLLAGSRCYACAVSHFALL